ncbi:MAG: hypothetical protein M1834_009292 [Cirrosporium novae-zelandiae]|nr:MAG: hypothetical protein M1834_009292 [Cirrosporium novae-zelandiae]
MANFSDINKEHWDNLASRYLEKDWTKVMINQAADFMHSKVEWMGLHQLDDAELQSRNGPSLLDYACGPGSVSKALWPYFSKIRGIDLSPNMAKEFNKWVSSQPDLGPRSANAISGDLLLAEGPSESTRGPEYENFDVAIVSFAFHHFEHPDVAARRLVDRLKVGGTFVIIDLLPHEHGIAHGHSTHTIAHNGFSNEKTKEILEGAGCTDVDIVIMDGTAKIFVADNAEPFEAKVFMAKGRKA